MSGSTVLWIAGVGWDQVTGTDKRIVLELSRIRPVVWIDPPVPLRRPGPIGASAPECVAPGVSRVRVTVLPGVTRWGLRTLTARIVESAAAGILAGLDDPTVVVAFPIARFPRSDRAVRVLYATDDWLDGAGLMGFSPDLVRRTIASNVDRAHGLAAVTPTLLALTSALGSQRDAPEARPVGAVIANGAPAPVASRAHRLPIAGLIGQINERIDLTLLEAVVDRGVPLRIVGPRTDRDAAFGRRLDALLGAPGVEWTGGVPHAELPAHLGEIGVGLTPYVDSRFNRSSFPLKTLEYLSAGLCVVSSDLPASRWLDSPHVVVRGEADAFADAVVAQLALAPDADREDECRELAAAHSWSRRAEELTALIELARARRSAPVG